MKVFSRYLLPAVVLMVVGIVTWTAGRLEQRSTEGRKQLLTLIYEGPAGEYDDLERDLRYLRAVPPLGAIDGDVREQRATSSYWRGSYDELAPKTNSAGEVTERDPALLLVGANAAYRSIAARENDPDAVTRLEGLLNQYSDILRKGAWQFDAAYNYEFLARRRDALVRARGQKPGSRTRQAAIPAAPPHTIHGRAGEVPPGADMNEFKVIVPQRSDERREQPEAGKGGPKARKG